MESTPKPTKEEEEEIVTAVEIHSPVDFSLAARPPSQLTGWKRRGEEEEEQHIGDIGAEENLEKLQLKKALTALLHGIEPMPFTREEMLRLVKVHARHVLTCCTEYHTMKTSRR